MSVAIHEVTTSREFEEGQANSYEFLYWADATGGDEENEAAVLAALKAAAPATHGVLIRQTVRGKHQGGGIWLCSVSYGVFAGFPGMALGDSVESFEISGGPLHITATKVGTYLGYVAAGSVPNLDGAIGYNGKEIEGVDIMIPEIGFSVTKIVDDADMDATYKAILAATAYHTNDATFRSYLTPEVLFLGVSGAQRSDDEWELTYRFGVSTNASSHTFGTDHPIVVDHKDGWEYEWIMYRDEVSQNSLVKEPRAVYVHAVYEEADFDLLDL